jgi:biofilm PGA synthesis N-glycosyltransferase PgaC
MNSKPNALPAYVLITPARDEAAFIRKTLEAMALQTVKPLKWIIVSDGSTDGTDEIVKEYVARHNWIELLRMPERKERHFGGKVRAFNAGYERVKNLEFEVIGNLDADSSFEPDYLEYLLEKFAQNSRLGVAGTNYVENEWDRGLKHDYRFANIEDVTGQCQLFRRQCFEDIHGYQPSKVGGVDLIATISARMAGWQTRVFTDKLLFHHRQQGTAEFFKYTVELSNGRKDFLFGSHPLFEINRGLYRLTKRPIILGSCLLLIGYFGAMLKGTPKVVSPEFTKFRRREQMRRLRTLLRRLFGQHGASINQQPSVA